MARKTIFEQASSITHAYFGPDATEHLAHFIAIHLRKPAEQLTRDELISLTDWIKGAASFLAEDERLVDHYIHDLIALAESEQAG